MAERKIEGLVQAGASITVISPRLTKRLNELLEAGAITHRPKRFAPGDITTELKEKSLVFAASCKADVNERVAKAAQAAGLWVNVADATVLCDFILPAVLESGPLSMAVSTSAKSPYLAKALRDELADSYGPEYGKLSELMGAIRQKLLKNKKKGGKSERIFSSILASPILDWIRDGNTDEIDSFLGGLLGKGYTLKGLGVEQKGIKV